MIKMKRALPFVLAVILLSACGSTQDVSYFQDIKNSSLLAGIKAEEIKLSPNDKVSIVVKTKDPTLSELFNLSISQHVVGYRTDPASYQSQSPQSQYSSGYTVDPDGNIDFPILGSIHVGGLTRTETANKIKHLLLDGSYAKEVVVTVEFMNLHIAVLGEVKEPGQYTVDQDRLTLLDALAKAGDMTIYGRRDSVIVMRQTNGQQQAYIVNMTSAQDMLNSPAFSLQQNDVVYVAPNKYRQREATVNGNQTRSTTFWISLASLLSTVLTTVAVFVVR